MAAAKKENAPLTAQATLLKEALANANTTFIWKGREYQLEEWDLNDVADLEEALGTSFDSIDISKPAHMRLILWLAIRRNDEMLTPAERRACRYRITLEDVGTQIKLKDLRTPETLIFLGMILKASGLVDTNEGNEDAEDEAVSEPTGETS